jgi:hypothetical protein
VRTEKKYAEATGFFEKVLELDSLDEEAKKYKALPEKTLAGTGNKLTRFFIS